MRTAIEIDAAACARAAAGRCAAAAARAQAARGAFHLALAGGRTPRAVHAALARRRDLDWSRTHIYWSDERAVPPDSAASNYAMARESLFDHLRTPPAAIHRMQAERPDLERAALDYEHLLRTRLGDPPELDFVFLGLGPDAHTASLFPYAGVLNEARRCVRAVASAPIAPRLTLTLRALAVAREVLFVVTGADKAAAVAAVHGSRRDIAQFPAQGVAGPHVAWLLDRDAAGVLASDPPPA